MADANRLLPRNLGRARMAETTEGLILEAKLILGSVTGQIVAHAFVPRATLRSDAKRLTPCCEAVRDRKDSVCNRLLNRDVPGRGAYRSKIAGRLDKRFKSLEGVAFLTCKSSYAYNACIFILTDMRFLLKLAIDSSLHGNLSITPIRLQHQ